LTQVANKSTFQFINYSTNQLPISAVIFFHAKGAKKTKNAKLSLEFKVVIHL